jgi:hypothetical protein
MVDVVEEWLSTSVREFHRRLPFCPPRAKILASSTFGSDQITTS